VNPRAYYSSLQAIIEGEPLVSSSDLTLREIDSAECYVRGSLFLVGGYVLHVAEYVITDPEPPSRIKYRYQLLDPRGRPVRRWDNAPHHRDVPSFPDHWHDEHDDAHPCQPVAIDYVLGEVESLLKG
jgi:hypothetical protein